MGLISTHAKAEDLCYKTSFERSDFSPGKLNTQDGWQNPQKTASISPVYPQSGKQSIRVFGNKLNEISPELVGTRFGRLFLYDATNKTIELSIDAMLDGPSTDSNSSANPNDDLISANLTLLLVDELNQPISIGTLLLSSNSNVWIIDSSGDYVAAIPINLNGYHRLSARIDFSSRKVQFFVDNEQVKTLSIPDSITSNIFAMGALEMFAVNDKKTLNRNHYDAYFDNFCVSTDSCEIQCL
ncbi:MAG: hypothetical protein K9L22_00860 [Methylococcaceae bacterium]|nr:hypothetical protein [Methylococcaceae bacterium]